MTLAALAKQTRQLQAAIEGLAGKVRPNLGKDFHADVDWLETSFAHDQQSGEYLPGTTAEEVEYMRQVADEYALLIEAAAKEMTPDQVAEEQKLLAFLRGVGA